MTGDHLMCFQSLKIAATATLNRVLSLLFFLSTVFSRLDYFFNVLDITSLLFLNCSLYVTKPVAQIHMFVVHYDIYNYRPQDDSAVLHMRYLDVRVPNKHLAGYGKHKQCNKTKIDQKYFNKEIIKFYKFLSSLTYNFFPAKYN